MKRKLVYASSLLLLSQGATMAGQYEEMSGETKNNGAFYSSLVGGVALFQDGKVDVKVNDSGAADFQFDTGTSMGLALGYDFGSLRLEGAFGYTQADISSLDTGTGSVSVDSQFSSYSFMANALWDFDFKPFVVSAGLGVGASKACFDQMDDNSGFIAVSESEETVFSGQLILSASYSLNEKTSLGVSYRYLMLSELNDNGYVGTNGADASDIKFDGVNASLIELFVTYKF